MRHRPCRRPRQATGRWAVPVPGKPAAAWSTPGFIHIAARCLWKPVGRRAQHAAPPCSLCATAAPLAALAPFAGPALPAAASALSLGPALPELLGMLWHSSGSAAVRSRTHHCVAGGLECTAFATWSTATGAFGFPWDKGLWTKSVLPLMLCPKSAEVGLPALRVHKIAIDSLPRLLLGLAGTDQRVV